MVAATVFAPLHFLAATSQFERHRQTAGMFVEHPQIELHDVPADDGVGVKSGKPFVELFQQQGSGITVLKLEIHLTVITVGRTQHVHLTLATTLQGNGIQLALSGGFDVQGHQFQARSIIGMRFHLRVEQQALVSRRAAKPHGRGDETLHHVAFRWTHVGFEHLDAGPAQCRFQTHQLTVLLAIQAEYRTVLEIQQGQGFELDVFFALQHRFGLRALIGGDERHRRLMRQADAPGTAVGRQPELDFRTGRGIAPMPGQDEALL